MNAILEQLKEYFNNTPRDVIEKEWHEYDKYNEIGPTVNEYLAFINQIIVKTEKKPIEPTKINETPNFYSEFFYFFAVNREDTSTRCEKYTNKLGISRSFMRIFVQNVKRICL